METSQLKRDLQYLKVLKTQKQNKFAEQKSLETQIARLRKNPTDKITNDLYIFQYNKKIETLKEEISAINKEILKLSKDLENFDSSCLSEDEKEDYSEEILELCPQQIQEQPATETEETVEETEDSSCCEKDIAPKSKCNCQFKALAKGLYNPTKLIILAVVSLTFIWGLYQWDCINLLYEFGRRSKMKFVSFMIMAFFSFVIVSFFSYKNFDKKQFGCFSDYFMLFLLISSLGLGVLHIINPTSFKLLIFLCLLAYSLIYFAIRIGFYGKNIKDNISSKPKFIQYYYNLFGKYSLIMVALIFAISLVCLYLILSTGIISSWLAGNSKNYNVKVWMIIDLIILELFVFCCVFFAFVNLGENKLTIIDLGCLLTQIVCLEFFGLAIARYSSVIHVMTYVIFALLFVVSTAVTVYRIINFKKNEI